MKKSLAEVNERRNDLLTLLEQLEMSDIKTLAERLAVSEMTVRRDCNALSKMGRIKQSFGKIEFIKDIDPTTQNIDALEKIKMAIAQEAAGYVENDDTLFINTSSTALLSLSFLQEKAISLLTNNIKVVHLDHNPQSTIFLTGGEVRFQKEGLSGDRAVAAFAEARSDVTIIGVSGISIENGISTSVMHEAKVNSQIVQNSGQLIVVADYRKVGSTSNFKIGELRDIDLLITDQYADKATLDAIESLGGKVIQVFI